MMTTMILDFHEAVGDPVCVVLGLFSEERRGPDMSDYKKAHRAHPSDLMPMGHGLLDPDFTSLLTYRATTRTRRLMIYPLLSLQRARWASALAQVSHHGFHLDSQAGSRSDLP